MIKIWLSGLITIECSRAVLMPERSSSTDVDMGRMVGVCILQEGNTNTAGRSTECSAALQNIHATSIKGSTPKHSDGVLVLLNWRGPVMKYRPWLQLTIKQKLNLQKLPFFCHLISYQSCQHLPSQWFCCLSKHRDTWRNMTERSVTHQHKMTREN